MTSYTEQFETLTERTQAGVSTAAHTWAETVQSLTDAVLSVQPDPKTVVDRWFDVAQQLLDEQRRFATTIFTAGVESTESVAAQTKSAATKTANLVTAAARRTTRNAEAAAEN